MLFDQQPSGPTLVGVTVQPKTSKSNEGGRSSFTINAISLTNKNLGFKVRTNKPLYYVVNPNRGIISAKRCTQIEVTISPYVTRQDVINDPDHHSFMFIGIVWNIPTFDNDLFEVLEASGTAEKQVITLTEAHTNQVGGAMGSMYGTNMGALGSGYGMAPGYGTNIGGMGPQSMYGTNPGGMRPVTCGSVYGTNIGTGSGYGVMPVSGYGSQYQFRAMGNVGEVYGRDSNNLMAVYPLTLSFTPPYGHGAPKQNHVINVTSTSSNAIAFKVNAEATMGKYYIVSPQHGVILPSSTVVVDFLMKDTFTHQSLMNCTEEHGFVIIAMQWPAKLSSFDEIMWGDLEKVHAYKQSTTLRIELDKSGDGCTSKNAEEAHEKEIKGPELVTVHPAVIAFTPPFGTGKQSTFVTVTNICSKKVAFKVHTNRVKYYFVRPNKGIVLPFKTVDIDFEMNEKFTIDEVKSNPRQHIFQIQLLEWPACPAIPFEQKTWEKLSKNKQLIQTITFDIEIPGVQFTSRDQNEHDKRHKKKHDEEDDGEGEDHHKKDKKKDHENEEEDDEDEKKGKVQHHKPSNRFPKSKKQGAVLITVTPMVLSYKHPFGKKRQESLVNIKSACSELIGYKLQTNKPNFYVVKPGRGLLYPGKDIKINFELTEKFTDKDLKDAPWHKFEVLALPWPKKHDKDYNNDVWKTLEAKNKDQLQVVPLKVNFNSKD